MFGKKNVAVLFPHASYLDIYTQSTSDNHTRLEVNLVKEGTELDLLPAIEFFKTHKYDSYTVVLNDDVVSTKSFVYDEKTETVSKEEVIKLSESSVTFELDPEYVEYSLEQIPGKTIVRATLYNKLRIKPLKENIAKLKLSEVSFSSRASLEAKVIDKYYTEAYFLLMPSDEGDKKSLALIKNKQIYLTHRFKSALPDLQKIINYSGMYFDAKTDKLFLPKNTVFKYKSTTKLDHAEFDPPSVATQLGYSSNIPLCALGAFLSDSKPVNIPISTMNNVNMTDTPNMSSEKGKSILPLILVFLITAAVVGAIVYFGFMRGENSQKTPTADVTPTSEPVVQPTIAPTPTLAMPAKTIKVQVLNATDINGQASVVKEKFVSAGYTDVTTGNSKEKLTQNEIRLKADGDMYTDYLKSILGDSFSAASVKTSLTTSGTYDIVVVIATDLSKPQAATTTPDATAEETPVDTETATVTPTTSTKKSTPTPTKKLTTTPTPTKKLSPTPTE